MDLPAIIRLYLGDTPLASAEALSDIPDVVDTVSFSKGTRIIEEGKYHPYFYFITQGGVRSFHLKDGIEVNNWFAFEQEPIGSFQNFQGQPARDTIQALEDTTCLRLDLETLIKKQQESLIVSKLMCSMIGEHLEFLEDRLRQLQHHAGIERYQFILEHEPVYLQRVPLTYLASYLGMTRETLSRLRKKITT